MSLTEGLFDMTGLGDDWRLLTVLHGMTPFVIVADRATGFPVGEFRSTEDAMAFCIDERLIGAVTDPAIWQ